MTIDNISSRMAAAAGPNQKPVFVRLSFRKGGEKAFYAALKRTLLAKEWSKVNAVKGSVNGNASEASLSGSKTVVAGIGGCSS